MAIPTQTAWEVRITVGASTNGGGYVVGTTATTTDYSQFNNKNSSGGTNCGSTTQDLSTTDAVAVGTTTITSATANFVAAKGNIVYFSGGSGGIAAVRRQVVSVTNVTTIVLDAAIAASTGMTMNIGGALDSPVTALLANTSGNIIWWKGTLVSTTGITVNNAHTPTATSPPNQLIGYTSTRGDGGMATIQLSTNSNLTGVGGTFDGWVFQNITVDCNSLTNSIGIRPYVSSSVIHCKVLNHTSIGIDARGNCQASVTDCEVTLGTSAATGGIVFDNPGGSALRNYIHDNAHPGIVVGSTLTNVQWNIVANNSGASSDGILLSSPSNTTVTNNVVFASGRDGIRWAASGNIFTMNIRNNLLVNNGTSGTGYGLNATSAAYPAFPNYDGNGYFGNATGTRHNLDDTGSTNPIYASAPYTNIHDVILPADPFTNSAGEDFTLNATAGGLAARGIGTPGTFTGASGTGYIDLGAFQHQDTAPVVSGMIVSAGMDGGMRG